MQPARPSAAFPRSSSLSEGFPLKFCSVAQSSPTAASAALFTHSVVETKEQGAQKNKEIKSKGEQNKQKNRALSRETLSCVFKADKLGSEGRLLGLPVFSNFKQNARRSR